MVGSSASNGAAESAVSMAGKGIRKLRIALENNYKIKLPSNHQVVPWLVLHAGFCHNRYQLGHDGRTPYSRIRGKPFNAPICEFAESIWYKIPKRLIGPDLNKWDDKWSVGVFLGVRTSSNEIYVGTGSGIVKCRTIRRRPASQRWSA